jgi:hypothetical protein
VLFGDGRRGGAALAWQLDAGRAVRLVDATTGRLLWRAAMVHSATGTGRAWAYHPGAASGGAAAPVTFTVWDGSRLRGDNAHVYKDVRDTIEVPGGTVPAKAEVPATGGLDWSG